MRRPASHVIMACVVLLLSGYVQAGDLRNQMAGNPSAYLAMHAADPVKWQLWGPEVVQAARRANKLLYVSIGYFSCHWCHVMQRESYRNDEIAAVLNANFIPVKVDRELNPALDANLIEFVESTRGYSGWPLNVFITPEGHPLIGIVYLPPQDFLSLISNLSDEWQRDAAGLKVIAEQASGAMSPPELQPRAELADGIGQVYEAALVNNALSFADDIQGGFGNQSKFPQAPQLLALLAAHERQANAQLGRFLVVTLDHMMSKGLHDLLGGGFFRYTVDPGWRTPHFEKMLYDNALLADLYLRAARVFDQPRYEALARRTLDFMLRELMTKEGAFAASLSAVDDQGIEGGYYLWDRKSLERLLSPRERGAAEPAWDIQGEPELEAGHLPIEHAEIAEAAQGLDMPEADLRTLLQAAREKLFAARLERHVPRDDKRLAAWNGLALAALVRAARLQDSEVYRAAARRLRDYIAEVLWDGQRLYRARGSAGAIGQAALEDYAYAAAGLLAWADLTGREHDYSLVRAVTAQAWQRFYGTRGWRLAEEKLIAYGGSEAMITDGPLPSPSGVLLDVSLQLAKKFDDEVLLKRALGALNTGYEILGSEPFWYATHVAVIAAYQAGEAGVR